MVKPSEAPVKSSEDFTMKKPQPVVLKTKSQASLLAGAIRRKRESGSEVDVPPKQMKNEVSALRPVGILPGLGPYSSSDTSDSDSEPEILPLITSAKTVTDSDN